MSNKTLLANNSTRIVSEEVFKKVFLGLMAMLLIVLPLLGLKSGINADEKFHSYIARYVVPFYTSFGEDRRLFITQSEAMPTYNEGLEPALEKKFGIDMLPMEDNFKNYGAGFEFFSGLINEILGIDSHRDPAFHNVRHVLLGLITALILLFTGLTAKELIGWRGAVLAVMLLLISPRFMGHGFMNNKDIPFALGYVITAFFTLRFLKQLPTPSWRSAMGVMIGFAAALNIRVGGLLLFFYFGLFCITFWAYFSQIKQTQGFTTENLKGAVLKAVVASLAGYFLGLVLWPYGLLDPLSHPLEVLQEQSKFPVYINQLWEGKVVSSKDLPWYYLSKFIGMTTPLVVLLGFLLCLGLTYKLRSKINLGLLGVVLFMFVFPVAYIAYSKANVYNGMRHVLFVYPMLVILAAVGFYYVLEWLEKPIMRYGIGVLIALLSLMPAYYSVANIPYQYTYYNPLIGGIEGAKGYYTTDYWMMGVREASEWLIENENLKDKKNIRVAADATFPAWVYLTDANPDVVVPYVRFHNRSTEDWDYGIFYSEYVSPAMLQSGNWPPSNAIYTVEAGGVPIVTVLKRTSKLDQKALRLNAEGKYGEALPVFQQALKEYPQNDALYVGMGLAALNVGNMQLAKQAFGSAIQLRADDATYHYYMAIAYAQSNPPDLGSAANYLRKALEINPGFQQAAQLLQQISSSGGGTPFGR